MGTIIVGGALVIVVALIIFNMVRKIRQGKSAFCTSSNCNCGCGEDAQSHHHESEKQ